jgi:hypothetical protein
LIIKSSLDIRRNSQMLKLKMMMVPAALSDPDRLVDKKVIEDRGRAIGGVERWPCVRRELLEVEGKQHLKDFVDGSSGNRKDINK